MENVFAEFLINSGLYNQIEITERNFKDLKQLFDGSLKLDAYCVQCKVKRPFAMLRPECKDIKNDRLIYLSSVLYKDWFPITNQYQWLNPDYIESIRLLNLNFYCTMDPEHHLDFTVLINGNKMRKIGQYPSYSDINIAAFQEYKDIVNDLDLSELKQANYLSAHGISIGAFIYLRRVFERLIDNVKADVVQSGVKIDDEFDRKKMPEKIQLIQEYLPDFVVDNSSIYGILSEGVHKLDEETCNAYFEIVRDGILIMLKKTKQKQDEIKEERKLERDLQKLKSDLGQRKFNG